MMNAMDHIRNGECDLCLAGASDAAVLSGIAGFAASKALSTRNDDPEGESRPGIRIETVRHGRRVRSFVFGVVRERVGERCADTGRDFGRCGDVRCAPHDRTVTKRGRGEVGHRWTLKNTGVLAEDVNYINAHATVPSRRFSRAEDDYGYIGENSELKINSTKSLIGHLLGAAARWGRWR